MYIYILYICMSTYILCSYASIHLYICSVHWRNCLMGQFSRAKNLANWDECLFTRMCHYLSFSKMVLTLSQKRKNDQVHAKYMHYVKYRMLIKYDI